jgi:glycosyltransferase involved in cell wall biosynthesis
MSVVYNGIQLTDTDSNTSSKEINELTKRLKNKIVIGTSSRFVSFKRIDRLIKAFSKLENIEQRVLLLVGDGILRSKLKEQVEELNISNSVIFTGYASNVRDFQQLMDVSVFPSQSEPFGLVAIETLSLNKPTIVFADGGGLKEIITGISSDDVVNDEFELTSRLEEYITNFGIKTETNNSRVDYAKGFSIETACENFNDIYRQIRQYNE